LSLIGGKPRWCHSSGPRYLFTPKLRFGSNPPRASYRCDSHKPFLLSVFVTILSRHLVLDYTLYFCNLRNVFLTPPPYDSRFDSSRDLSGVGYTTSKGLSRSHRKPDPNLRYIGVIGGPTDTEDTTKKILSFFLSFFLFSFFLSFFFLSFFLFFLSIFLFSFLYYIPLYLTDI